MVIREFNNEDRGRWDEYVLKTGASSGYHQIGWKNVIERSFGHRTHYLWADNGHDEIQGVLPIVQMKSMLFGNFMVSLPYVNYGGICADSREASDRLLETAIRIAAEQNAEHLELRHTHPGDHGLAEKTGKAAMRLTLPRRATELWSGFASKLRSQIRRPAKDGMSARFGREGELDSFYEVLSINMRDLGTPVYSREFFGNILTEFPETTWICTICTKEGEPVASGFLVGFRQGLELPWASSLRTFNHSGPNMLLYWSALEFACDRGFRFFDFGRSTPGEGTYRFKEQWGARPIQLYWHYWIKDGGDMPQLNPKNPRYRKAIEFWRHLPVGLTKLIGPGIVKNLP